MSRFITLAAACMSLAACASSSTPGTSPTAFDGTYQGSITLTHSNNQGGSGNGVACATAGQKDGALMVQNGNVVWANGGGNIYAPVSGDGSFAAQNGGTFFSGKITNRAMVARGNISGCHTIYDLQKANT